jgi:hypothetical protein
MSAESAAFGVLFFAIGIALQAFAMLWGSIRRGDGPRVYKALGFSLIGMLVSHSKNYSVLGHILLSLTMFATLFTYYFRERLLPRIGGRMLLAWNILLIYVVLRAGWGSPVTLALLAIPTVPTIVNAFSDIDRAFGWKVFFHAWFSTILVLIAIRGFNAGPLAFFLGRATPWFEPSAIEMLVGGAAYLYIAVNAWFVLALIPIPWYRGEGWEKREQEIREQMNLLARGYVWEKEDLWRSLAVLVALPLVLIGATRLAAGAERVMVALTIALMPWLGTRPTAKQDGRH